MNITNFWGNVFQNSASNRKFSHAYGVTCCKEEGAQTERSRSMAGPLRGPQISLRGHVGYLRISNRPARARYVPDLAASALGPPAPGVDAVREVSRHFRRFRCAQLAVVCTATSAVHEISQAHYSTCLARHHRPHLEVRYGGVGVGIKGASLIPPSTPPYLCH